MSRRRVVLLDWTRCILGLDYEPEIVMPTAEGQVLYTGPNAKAYKAEAQRVIDQLHAEAVASRFGVTEP